MLGSLVMLFFSEQEFWVEVGMEASLTLSLQFGMVLYCGLGTSSESHKFDRRTLRNVTQG